MKIIYKPRGTGKTTDLVRRSADKKIPILTMYRADVLYIKGIAKDLGLDIPEPLTADKPIPSYVKSVLIDEADLILRYLLDVDIECVTISQDDFRM